MVVNRNLHVVTKTEVHYLPLCNCHDCQAEKIRRQKHPTLPPHVVPVPIGTARILGMLKNPSPHGSVARDIQMEAESTTPQS